MSVTVYEVATVMFGIIAAIYLPEFWFRSTRLAGVVVVVGTITFYLVAQISILTEAP